MLSYFVKYFPNVVTVFEPFKNENCGPLKLRVLPIKKSFILGLLSVDYNYCIQQDCKTRSKKCSK